MNAYLYPACAIIVGIVTLIKLPTLWTRRTPTHVVLWLVFAGTTLLFTISSPTVWPRVSAAIGITNISGLITQGLVIVLAALQQVLVLLWVHDSGTAWRKVRVRLSLFALVLVAMSALFFASMARGENPNDFALAKAGQFPYYLTVYVVSFCVAQGSTLRICLQCARKVSDTWLRRGLLLTAVGCGADFVYAGGRLGDIMVAAFGASGVAWEPVVQIAAVTSAILRPIAWTIPSWGHHLTDFWAWVGRVFALRRLAPLHARIVAVVPEVRLPLEAGTPVDTRLYRMLIEIRDGQRALQPWMSSLVASDAAARCGEAGIVEGEAAAVIEAAQLRVAVEAAEAGVPQRDSFAATVAEPTDLAGELAHQRAVARAFRSSPIVDAVARDERNRSAEREIA
ncbi:MAB_1171c family putative transporter [Kutzneria sp. 744]|uniref:MAB_1171c family putative transporter n=1 Tax=Kutzneria sp. (strain 744) TaxID=345341 RepID=UPI0003EED764|nr:MAB_1171c family putative transporter [Kutzneria sp. 744]EWM12767.1 LigA protein [Kutzneria sp. 744]